MVCRETATSVISKDCHDHLFFRCVAGIRAGACRRKADGDYFVIRGVDDVSVIGVIVRCDSVDVSRGQSLSCVRLARHSVVPAIVVLTRWCLSSSPAIIVVHRLFAFVSSTKDHRDDRVSSPAYSTTGALDAIVISSSIVRSCYRKPLRATTRSTVQQLLIVPASDCS